MDNNDLAKVIVGNLLDKKADITKEIPASSGKDLFGNEAESEVGDAQLSDKDLFGNNSVSDSEDRENANLPPEVSNSDDSGDVSDTEDLKQGYQSNGNKADDVYTGSGDGPKI